MQNIKKYIVITGAVGFIGSGLVRYLNDLGKDQLILVDDLGSTEKWKNLYGKSFADILDKSQLFDWLKGRADQISTIVHLGACTNTTETNASYLLENNYRYSVKLLEYAAKHNIRFIYASSAATYGDGSHGFCDDHDALETLRPLNMYGMSKHLFDMWVKKQGLLTSVTGLKFFNVFGPNEYHKGRMASLIMHILPRAKENGKISLFQSSAPDLFADGGQMRDFVYVKDTVKMISAFMDNEATGIYNIATGHAKTWNDLAHAVFDALEIEGKIEYIPMPKDLIGKYQNYTCADMAKTKNALKKAADCLTLNESVKDYICSHLIPEKIW